MTKPVVAYFDFASPWAYLAYSVAGAKLPGITIDWQPIYLRGLETFAKGMPYTNAKLAYLLTDYQRCMAHENVPVAAPATFPIDGLASLRGALVAKERGVYETYCTAVFRATWAESKDVSNKATIAGILGEIAHAPPDEILAAMASPSVKDTLRENTENAQRRGVFGTPTFFVGDEMFWGADRLDYVARAAAG